MIQPQFLEQAKQGDPQAIAVLMNQALQSREITARVERQGNHLEVFLESDRIPNQQALTAFVEKGMQNLGTEAIKSIRVAGQQIDATSPAWTQELSLDATSSAWLQELSLREEFDAKLSSKGIKLFAEPGVGEVEAMITPHRRGRIKFRGSYWPARFYPEAQTQALPSERVAVIGRDGLTLLVAPMTASAQAENVVSAAQSGDQESEPQLVINRDWQQAQYFIENLGDGVTLEMVLIPAGSFVMGAPEDEEESQHDERPQHPVTIPPFCMGKYPVTQAQWRAVAALPQVNRELDPDSSNFKGADRPVEQVSWYEAVEFCDRLSQKTGRDYRLPSEAEWEYACRAGTTAPFHFGETIATDLANYDGDYTYGSGPEGTYRGETTPVGSFGVANAFGLYDMHGNVWEWCLDHWHGDYQGAPTDGSAWLTKSKNVSRLLRGGSWGNYPRNCRSASRYYYVPDNGNLNIGFRVVCSSAWTL